MSNEFEKYLESLEPKQKDSKPEAKLKKEVVNEFEQYLQEIGVNTTKQLTAEEKKKLIAKQKKDTEKIKTQVTNNLKTFTTGEIKSMIDDNNKKFAIKGYSKFTKKDELIKFLTENHLRVFKNIMPKSHYKEYFKNNTYEQFQKDKKNFDELTKYIIGSNLSAGKALDKQTIFKNYVLKNKPLPDNASPEYKKLYKTMLKQWKAKQEKELEKLREKVKFQQLRKKEKLEEEAKLKKELEDSMKF